MRKIIWITCLFGLIFSCKKEADVISISNLVKQTQHYNNEIFSVENQKIYGKWKLLYTYGGIGGSTTKPVSDYYFEFIPFGTYGKIENNQIKEIGKLRIVKQENNQTVIDFVPDEEYKSDYFLIMKLVEFEGKDTLILSDYRMGDGYNNYFKRVK